jgi:hypothetical protein
VGEVREYLVCSEKKLLKRSIARPRRKLEENLKFILRKY